MDDATLRQVTSADPGRSTWVSANAGSGKTRVLTDRVARLLLRGVPPQRVLCLTYTKAAASEMQVRLFRTLGAWAMAADHDLRDALAALGEAGPFGADALARARRMFATAIETPGGLKIQTIHAFCAAVLRRFPLEAGVSPAFREIDSRAENRLRAEVLDRLALDDPALFAEFAAEAGSDLDAVAQAVAGETGEPGQDDIWRAHGLSPGDDDATLDRACGFGDADAAAIAAIARAPFEAKTDLATAAKLAPLAGRDLNSGDLPVLEDVFLSKAGAKVPFSAKTGTVPTQKTGRPLVSMHEEQIDDLMARVEAARPLRLALGAARRTWLLYRFGTVFSRSYAAAKAVRGLLDFDDLLLKTRALLSDPAVSDWVLYGLDGGIDHVLVDEAQDTSPVQWDVIEYLTREFTAGIGARGDTLRTIFVVGDKKQSIYSFQGARPEAFDRMREGFAARLAPGDGLAGVELLHSFRSAPAILEFVDRALGPVADRGLGPAPRHIAFHPDRPGRVDLWPLVAKEDAAEDDAPWYEPLDRLGTDHPARRLAAGLAAEVAAFLARGERIVTGEGEREVRPGDILILVRRRSGPLFREILNRLKAAGLPVAGADLLDLDTELAVSDLRSLLAFLANEDDDLALAEALRSPLLGMDEGGLFRIAHGRKGSLWHALRQSTGPEDSRRAILDDLRTIADYRRPFDVLDRILTRHDGRRRLLARLGPEAEEGIDALLAYALQYEMSEPASLSGFLTWLAQDEVKVKRQTDNAGDQIRVMTAHGAKGLEAPVVILPDMSTRRRNARGDGVLRDESGMVWKPPAEDMDNRAARALAEKIEREQEEDMRLLYVAMTRAESWLILGAAGESKDGSWYDLVSGAFDGLESAEIETVFGPGQRYARGDWPAPDPAVHRTDRKDGSLPDWLNLPLPAPGEAPAVLSPSRLGGAKALASEGGLSSAEAMAHGTLVHRLLELLPGVASAEWPAVAANLGAGASALAEARAVLEDDALAAIFAPGTFSEVDITATLPDLGGARLRGTIDRLVVGADRVLAVDFKTNAGVPAAPDEVPEGLLRQMGAYAAALEQVFPGRRVETALLWTRTATLMVLPHNTVTAALRSAPTS